MSNVRKGHDFEREVKKMFKDAGWFCTRAAGSMSPMDLIAYTKELIMPVYGIFMLGGYDIKACKTDKYGVPLLASKSNATNIKHVYFVQVQKDSWTVVLMQCKIKKRRRAKARR